VSQIHWRLAGRLTSVQMRSWLADFLRQPHCLLPDPGVERVSLTLPKEAVLNAAGFLRCSPSTALRRVAAERLGLFSGMVDEATFASQGTRTDATLINIPARSLPADAGRGNLLNVALPCARSIACPLSAVGIMPQPGRRIWPPEPLRPVPFGHASPQRTHKSMKFPAPAQPRNRPRGQSGLCQRPSSY
jgi:hypothetical protein